MVNTRLAVGSVGKTFYTNVKSFSSNFKSTLLYSRDAHSRSATDIPATAAAISVSPSSANPWNCAV